MFLREIEKNSQIELIKLDNFFMLKNEELEFLRNVKFYFGLFLLI
jgi:hypothetical protein